MEVGAISLIIRFPEDLVSISGIDCGSCSGDNNFFYKIYPGELRIGWFESDKPISFKENDLVLRITGRTKVNFKQGKEIMFTIAGDPSCEFADKSGNPIKRVTLKTNSIINSNNLIIGDPKNTLKNELSVYPNPTSETANIDYSISNNGRIRITLCNILGEKIKDIIEKDDLTGSHHTSIDLKDISSGIYFVKMYFNGNNSLTRKIVVSR